MTWIWRHLVSCLQCRLLTLGLAIQSIIILVIISLINLVTPPPLKKRLFWTALWKERSHKIRLPSKSHNSHHNSKLLSFSTVSLLHVHTINTGRRCWAVVEDTPSLYSLQQLNHRGLHLAMVPVCHDYGAKSNKTPNKKWGMATQALIVTSCDNIYKERVSYHDHDVVDDLPYRSTVTGMLTWIT